MSTRFSFPARWQDVATYADRILSSLPPDTRTSEVHFGVVEALSNAVVHGAMGIASRGDGIIGVDCHLARLATHTEAQGGMIEVEVRTGEEVTIVISDPGTGFDWRVPPRKGHGLTMVSAIFERVSWNERGNQVCLVVRPGPRGLS